MILVRHSPLTSWLPPAISSPPAYVQAAPPTDNVTAKTNIAIEVTPVQFGMTKPQLESLSALIQSLSVSGVIVGRYDLFKTIKGQHPAVVTRRKGNDDPLTEEQVEGLGTGSGLGFEYSLTQYS